MAQTNEDEAYQYAISQGKAAAELLSCMANQGVTQLDSVSNRVSIAVTSMHASEALAVASFYALQNLGPKGDEKQLGELLLTIGLLHNSWLSVREQLLLIAPGVVHRAESNSTES